MMKQAKYLFWISESALATIIYIQNRLPLKTVIEKVNKILSKTTITTKTKTTVETNKTKIAVRPYELL